MKLPSTNLCCLPSLLYGSSYTSVLPQAKFLAPLIAWQMQNLLFVLNKQKQSYLRCNCEIFIPLKHHTIQQEFCVSN